MDDVDDSYFNECASWTFSQTKLTISTLNMILKIHKNHPRTRRANETHHSDYGTFAIVSTLNSTKTFYDLFCDIDSWNNHQKVNTLFTQIKPQVLEVDVWWSMFKPHLLKSFDHFKFTNHNFHLHMTHTTRRAQV